MPSAGKKELNYFQIEGSYGSSQDWFLLTGYEERTDGFFVTTATCGRARIFNFAAMWDTGNAEKGGMVRYR